MASRILLLRHGRIAPAPTYYGTTDLPLDEVGLKQARQIASLTLLPPFRCLCSPRKRALQTLAPLCEKHGLAYQTDEDLREIDFGRWEGKTFPEILKTDPELVDRWAKGDPDFAFPGGEALRDFQRRVIRATERMLADPTETVLAVAHGGVIRVALCHLLGIPHEHGFSFAVKPATLVSVEVHEGKGVLTGLREMGNEEA